MKKVIIFGTKGMAGHIIDRYLSSLNKYEVIRCARKARPGELEFDALDFAGIEQIINDTRPDFAINCVGMLVEACKEHISEALLINSYLPNFLSKLGRKYKFKLIHISTDCVFSGATGGYRDDDFRDGDTNYARTKALGEIVNDIDLTVRTSIIGPEIKTEGSGLFNWFMRQHVKVNGYTHAFWSGVTTLELAKFTAFCLEHNITGLVQLTMSEKISKFELLKLFQKIWQKNDIAIEAYDDYYCDKSLISTRKDIEYSLPKTYEDMLSELRNWQ